MIELYNREIVQPQSELPDRSWSSVAVHLCVLVHIHCGQPGQDSDSIRDLQCKNCNVRTAMLLHAYMYKSEEDREKQVPTDTVISKPACI